MSIEKLKEVIPKDFKLDIDFINKSVKKLKIEKKARILDVGTGFGIMSIILALNGFDVMTGEPERDPEKYELEGHSHDEHHGHYGGDESNYDYNWEKNATAVGVKDKIKHQHFDAQELPFPDESYDGIFLYDALQHINGRKRALKECIRVLAPKGLIAVTEMSKKGINYMQEKEGWAPDYVDPRDLLDEKDISIEIFTGRFSNMYIIRKI